MNDLKLTLNVHRFCLMRKQNIEERLPWLRITCSVGLIGDITVFCWIVYSLEMEFKLATLVSAHCLKVSVEYIFSGTFVHLMSVPGVCGTGSAWQIHLEVKKKVFRPIYCQKRADVNLYEDVNLCANEKIRIYIVFIRPCNIDSFWRTSHIR